jgi:hypothetical protein
MSEPNTTPNVIDPAGVYSVRELARIQRTGAMSIRRPIRSGRLRAAVVNDRGDQRILGQWFLDYLAACAQRDPATNP